MKLKVFRYDGESSWYDNYEIKIQKGQTVLDALFHIQENIDDSLSFRYSCRGAVCGSCAMLIDKIPRLACRTQIRELKKSEDKIELEKFESLKTEAILSKDHVLIEPLPHLEVKNDLIVDMEKFFRNYREIQPYISFQKAPTKEYHMDTKEVEELEDYTNCILCAACFGACPVNGKNENYLGPAALAKLYRFYLDSRDEIERLKLADHEDGWWACEFYTNCEKVCPKDVPPNLAIGDARRKLQREGDKDEL